DLVQFLLSVDEAARHGVVDQGFAVRFEVSNLVVADGAAELLFLIEGLALFHHRLVLRLGLFVRHEGVDSTTDGLKLRQLRDGLAEFFGLLQDRVFGGCLHNRSSVFAPPASMSYPASTE